MTTATMTTDKRLAVASSSSMTATAVVANSSRTSTDDDDDDGPSPPRRRRVLDPILTLPVPSQVTSLCFVSPGLEVNTPNDDNTNRNHHRRCSYNQKHASEVEEVDDYDENEEDDDDDDDDDIVFRSSAILSGDEASTTSRPSTSLFGTSSTLDKRFLVTCHQTGDAFLWDLKLQLPSSIVVVDGDPSSSNYRRGPGLAVRRTDNSSKFVYQTRDEKSTVSLHTCERVETVIRHYETFSRGFCQAAPCCGNEHLLALPYESSSDIRGRNDNETVIIVDHRSKEPAAKITVSDGNKHGMMTSLGLSVGGVKSQRPQEQRLLNRTVLACGMESGTAFFYDLAMPSQPIERNDSVDFDPSFQRCHHVNLPFSTFSLGKEPILTIDLIPSTPASKSRSTDLLGEGADVSTAVLAAAGLAGDAAELERLSKDEVGRISLFKATATSSPATADMTASNTPSSHFHFQQRARLTTLTIDCEDSSSLVAPSQHKKDSNKSSWVSAGKPGVSICRFRPRDGRLLAVGGWDRRVRLFDRTHGNPMAILRGHENSVSAFDWSHDSDTSGFLASSGRDTKIVNIWQCFSAR